MTPESVKPQEIHADLLYAAVQGGSFVKKVHQDLGATGGDFSLPFTGSSAAVGHWLGLSTEAMREQVREADLTGRREVAAAFARRASELPGVKEVWAVLDAEEPTITTIIAQGSLDAELQLEAALIGALEAVPKPFPGFLRVYAEDEQIPDFAREGERLLP